MAQTQPENPLLLCLDFDGTLTNKEGRALVFGDFYKSLQVNPEDHYKSALFKSQEDIQQIFQSKFGQPFDLETSYESAEADILISKEALTFLKKALGLETVSINIITKNRADYIRHVLTYQGFNTDQIAKIEINDTGLKGNATWSLQSQIPSYFAIVCDDNLQDAEDMRYGLITGYLPEDNIALFTANPGAFNWSEISELLMSRYQPVPSLALMEHVQARHESPYAAVSANLEADESSDGNPYSSFNLFGNEEDDTPSDHPLRDRWSAAELPSSSKHSIFTPKVIIPAILCVGFAAGAITTGLVGVHLAAPIVLGVLAVLVAILAIMMHARNTSPQYTSL